MKKVVTKKFCLGCCLAGLLSCSVQETVWGQSHNISAITGKTTGIARVVQTDGQAVQYESLSEQTRLESQWSLADNSQNIDINGYVNAGYLGNTYGTTFNGGMVYPRESTGSLNGVYGSVSKSSANNNGLTDWGYGVDFMFGDDAQMMRVENGLDEKWVTGHDRMGNDTYGFAMPQLYGEASFSQWTVKVGHFYSPLGYESARADERFFYTTGLSFDNLPVTVTGVLTSFNGFNNLDAAVGWINGVNQGFSDEEGGSAIVANLKYHFNDRVSLKYTFGAGDITDITNDNLPDFQENRTHLWGSLHTWVLEAGWNDRLTTVSTVDFSDLSNAGSPFNDFFGERNTKTVYGQHFYYTLNDCWKLGSRLEWTQSHLCGTDFTNEYFSMTYGTHWSPMANTHLTVRPEIRYDRSPDATLFGKNMDKEDQLCLGFDVLCQY